MFRLRKFILTWLLFTTLLFAFEIDPFNPNASLVENFSTNCLQMTQSQQMLKAYLMIGLNSNFQNPKKNLARAIVDYDRRAHQVHDYFFKRLTEKDKAARDAFDKAMQLWQESKKMLEQKPTQQNALKIKKNLLEMINHLLAGTKPLATPDLELISLTGKLCRKPVEITNDYLMRIWGIKIPRYEEEVAKIIKNFHKNLKTLSANRLNNNESLTLLKKAQRQFMFFEIMYRSKTRFIPHLLSKKADDNFLIIRKIKKIYKAQAQKDM
ncbi:MAG: hypothetical protein DSZ05_01970 [Sulfurospirillum sp.]|nr:MAG: hypothetical protein DSZ05_01970 [Sulfurospirillum sp.]